MEKELFGDISKEKASQKSRNLRLYKNSELEEEIIEIDLNRWKLLAQSVTSGAHWIFCTKNEQIDLNAQNITNLYQNGRYVMRMKKSKQFEKLVFKKYESIAEQLLKNSKTQQQTFKQLANSVSKQKAKKATNSHKQVWGADKSQQQFLNGLIQEVYKQFLTKCLSGNNCILPKIKQAIVKSSDKYFISVQQKTQNINQTGLFAQYIAEELIYYHFSNDTSFNQLGNELIQLHLLKDPVIIDEILLMECGFSTNGWVTFEQNQLVFEGSNGSRMEKNQLFEVFEFKPKPILPNVYTQQFIQYYLTNYHEIQSTYGIKSQQKHTNHHLNAKPPTFSSIESIIQSSLLISDQSSSQTYPNQKQLNIQSTRWFKKNCLSSSKKMDNPLFFFSPCLTDKYQPILKVQPIDFLNKKHLKKQVCGSDQQSSHQQTTRTELVYSSLINYINNNLQNRQVQSLSEVQSQKEDNLSLLEEILSLQIIDLADIVSINQRIQSDLVDDENLCENKEFYFDFLSIRSLTESLLKQLKHSRIQDSFCFSNQRLYPKQVFYTIKTLFKPQVYKKAHKLSLQLKEVIFSSPIIEKAIKKLFSSFQKQIFSNENTEIKLKIYYIVRLLVGLTWKDISFMVQTLTTFDNSNQTQQTLQNPQLSVVKCAIIDYGIKLISNIRKNIEKQKQFLFNYETFINVQNNFQKLTKS